MTSSKEECDPFMVLLREKYPGHNFSWTGNYSTTYFILSRRLTINNQHVFNFSYTPEIIQDMQVLHGISPDVSCQDLLNIASPIIDEYLELQKIITQANKDADINTDF